MEGGNGSWASCAGDEVQSLSSCDDRGVVALRAVAEGVSPTSRDAASARAVRHLRENLARTVSLREVADVAGIGKFALIRRFRSRFGVPVMGYLIGLRLANARLLLARGASCGEAAHCSGFYDQSHMNRWFMRIYGLTPNGYRKACIKETRRRVLSHE